jgi:hypothetical protein
MIKRFLIMTGTCGSQSFFVDILTFLIEHHEILHALSLLQEQKAREDILGRYHQFTRLQQRVQCHISQTLLLLRHLAGDIAKSHSPPIFLNNEPKTERNAVDCT